MTLNRRTALTAALSVAIATAGITGAATAGPGGDRNRDRLPDRWEKAHHLSLKLNQAARDRDHDGLCNGDEQRRGTRPDRRDSDRDGRDDGDEHSRNEITGTVVSFDAASGALVLRPASGEPVTVTVDDDTRFDDGSAADLVTGATVGEVRYVPDGTGGNVALKIEFEDEDGDDHGGQTRTTTTTTTATPPAA